MTFSTERRRGDDDRMDRGAGNDILNGGNGTNVLKGGTGEDTFVICNDGVAIVIDSSLELTK